MSVTSASGKLPPSFVCVCVLTALWRYYVIHIYTIYPLNMYNPLALNIFTRLYIHHHSQSSH